MIGRTSHFPASCLLTVAGFSLTVPLLARAEPVAAPTAEWNLEGAGGLTLPDNAPELQALGKALDGQTARLDLVIAGSGKIEACTVAAGAPPHTAAPALCDALTRLAIFARDPRLELPTAARLAVSATAFSEVAPLLPVRFAGKSDYGANAVLFLALDGSCSMRSLRVASRYEGTICSAWAAKGKPGLIRVGGQGTADVEVLIDRAATPSYWFSIGDAISQTGQTLSSLGDPPADRVIQPGQGRLRVAIGSQDYPPRAIREAVAGRVKVWVGFDRTGTPRTCRPVQSSNGAYLANMTCRTLFLKASYEFAEDAEQFTGIRYAPAAINWALP